MLFKVTPFPGACARHPTSPSSQVSVAALMLLLSYSSSCMMVQIDNKVSGRFHTIEQRLLEKVQKARAFCFTIDNQL